MDEELGGIEYVVSTENTVRDHKTVYFVRDNQYDTLHGAENSHQFVVADMGPADVDLDHIDHDLAAVDADLDVAGEEDEFLQRQIPWLKRTQVLA